LAGAEERLGLSAIPDELDFSLESWHDGTRRQYICRLTHVALDTTWTSDAHDDLEAAVKDALARSDTPPVDPGFWRGARSALPYALLGWAVLIVTSVVLWHLMST
jgi:hypothetical protein